MVVEDNNLNMVIMDRILSNQGVITSKAKNGLEALNLVESTEEGFFDAVEEDRRAAREAGMTDFLTQPVEPKLLLETLQKYVD